MRVLLLGPVKAEHGHHGVADELLDDAAVGLDVLVPANEVGVDDGADVLGIELLGQHREVDEIGEQDGDELALLGHRPSDELLALGAQRCRAVSTTASPSRPRCASSAAIASSIADTSATAAEINGARSRLLGRVPHEPSG